MVVVLVLMVELPEEDKVTSDCFGRIVYVDHDRTVEYIRIRFSFGFFWGKGRNKKKLLLFFFY